MATNTTRVDVLLYLSQLVAVQIIGMSNHHKPHTNICKCIVMYNADLNLCSNATHYLWSDYTFSNGNILIKKNKKMPPLSNNTLTFIFWHGLYKILYFNDFINVLPFINILVKFVDYSHYANILNSIQWIWRYLSMDSYELLVKCLLYFNKNNINVQVCYIHSAI